MRASSLSRAATTARLGLVVGVLVGTVTPANATTFVDVTLEQLADASDVVVVGRVEHVEAFPRGPGGQPGIHTRAVIQVAETLRGAPLTIIEVWVHGGRIGDRVRVVPGQAVFRPGEDLALFLFEGGGGLWPTGMARGKWHADAHRAWPGAADHLVGIGPRGVELPSLRRRLRLPNRAPVP